jgi:hypothetical protein
MSRILQMAPETSTGRAKELLDSRFFAERLDTAAGGRPGAFFTSSRPLIRSVPISVRFA